MCGIGRRLTLGYHSYLERGSTSFIWRWIFGILEGVTRVAVNEDTPEGDAKVRKKC